VESTASTQPGRQQIAASIPSTYRRNPETEHPRCISRRPSPSPHRRGYLCRYKPAPPRWAVTRTAPRVLLPALGTTRNALCSMERPYRVRKPRKSIHHAERFPINYLSCRRIYASEWFGPKCAHPREMKPLEGPVIPGWSMPTGSPSAHRRPQRGRHRSEVCAAGPKASGANRLWPRPGPGPGGLL